MGKWNMPIFQKEAMYLSVFCLTPRFSWHDCKELNLIHLFVPSVQFSHSVVSNSLQPHGLQHVRLRCPSPTPRTYSNSCPSCQWCHPTTSYSVVPFSFCIQSSPDQGLFYWDGSHSQSISISALASILPMNIQDWFPVGVTGSPCSPRDSQEFSLPLPR